MTLLVNGLVLVTAGVHMLALILILVAAIIAVLALRFFYT